MNRVRNFRRVIAVRHFIACFLFFLGNISFLQANNYVVKSPDGKLSLVFSYEKNTLSYSLSKADVAIVASSPIGVSIDGIAYPNAASAMKMGKTVTVDQVLKPEIRLKCEQFRDHYNEVVFDFGPSVKLRARAYNDAIAFRWETDMKDKLIQIDNEEFAIDFADKKLEAWMPKPSTEGDAFFSHQECMYTCKEIKKPYDPFCVPLLVNLKNGQLLLATDVNIDHFPGLWMKGDSGKFTSTFPAYPKKVFLKGNRSMQVVEKEAFIAKTPGKYQFPWRVLMVTDGKGLLESNTLYSLADPNRIGDTSWIKPGKVSWDWWNSFTIGDVGFTPGVNQQSYKFYIDFAAENGLPYIMLDEGWSNSKPEQFLEVVPSLNMPELSAYAQSKGVKLILWTTSTSLEMNFDKAFELFTKWGIAGIKVDFMQRDDQVMNEFCYRVAEEAAKRKLLVDFHGGSKPTGLLRTYPNVLSHESVRGMEQSLWNTKANPDMAIMNAFIRMSVGPMDYTPGAMINMTKDNFVPGKATGYKQMGSLGTRCQQLAMYVVYTSPIQMLCDSPTRYRNNSGSLDFLREVPTVWDETIALHADPCQSIAMAKRSGARWFVGCLTNSQGRELELDFSFLPKGKKYVMKSWADSTNANIDAQDNTVSEQVVDASSKIKITMANGGGFAAIISAKGSSAK